jgi:hemin uptake protein HemP
MTPNAEATVSPPRRLLSLPGRTPPAVPELRSDDLLRGLREVVIRHGGQTYRLRHTRNDKLILTK